MPGHPTSLCLKRNSFLVYLTPVSLGRWFSGLIGSGLTLVFKDFAFVSLFSSFLPCQLVLFPWGTAEQLPPALRPLPLPRPDAPCPSPRIRSGLKRAIPKFAFPMLKQALAV